jgi:hypothetical protein
VESWVTAMENKLANIIIITIWMVVTDILTMNCKLIRAGHIQRPSVPPYP